MGLKSGYGELQPRMAGRTCLLCPGTSDVNLLGNRQRVVHLVSEVTLGIQCPSAFAVNNAR
jgi:hypothetical protein